jgi:divalent metal cation (Fe/Co/Zn/Cd) transporter
VDLHVRVDPEISVAQGHAHAHALKDKIKTQMPLIEDVLIHVEPVETFPYEPPIPA